jgi:hypothetical protein
MPLYGATTTGSDGLRLAKVTTGSYKLRVLNNTVQSVRKFPPLPASCLPLQYRDQRTG